MNMQRIVKLASRRCFRLRLEHKPIIMLFELCNVLIIFQFFINEISWLKMCLRGTVKPIGRRCIYASRVIQ